MRYASLATDYDGTLATDGHVTPETVRALERFRRSGRRLILVTGREMKDLRAVFGRLDLFDRVVAENGGLLYRPVDGTEKALGEGPPAGFLTALQKRAVSPVHIGRVVVATLESQETKVREAIEEAGLQLQIILNKGSAMILPPGVDKATGLEAALGELELSRDGAIGVGDAENDHAFLAGCALAVAVANALPALKERADLVTENAHGAGVEELIERVLRDDPLLLKDPGDQKRGSAGTHCGRRGS